MNFIDFTKLIKKNLFKIVWIPFITGLFFGLISLFLPKSFVTEGTFILIPNFESSNIENNKNTYNFDGYYLDQISQSYSKTILGLIETPEFKKRVSSELGIDKSFKNLLLLNFQTNFKEIAPRILVLNVRSDSEESSKKMFSVYEKEILIFSEKYNSNKVFKVERLTSDLSTSENTTSSFIIFFSFFSFSLFLVILFYFLKELKNE